MSPHSCLRGPASWSPVLRWVIGKEVRGGTWGLRHEVTRWGELPSFLRETIPGVTPQKILLLVELCFGTVDLVFGVYSLPDSTIKIRGFMRDMAS